jgi:hypothetical protein
MRWWPSSVILLNLGIFPLGLDPAASTRCRETHSSIVDVRRVRSKQTRPVDDGRSGRVELFRFGLQVIRAITSKKF